MWYTLHKYNVFDTHHYLNMNVSTNMDVLLTSCKNACNFHISGLDMIFIPIIFTIMEKSAKS